MSQENINKSAWSFIEIYLTAAITWPLIAYLFMELANIESPITIIETLIIILLFLMASTVVFMIVHSVSNALQSIHKRLHK